jgi:hypothetical protein
VRLSEYVLCHMITILPVILIRVLTSVDADMTGHTHRMQPNEMKWAA